MAPGLTGSGPAPITPVTQRVSGSALSDAAGTGVGKTDATASDETAELRLYQIHYDDASRAQLHPRAIPLDNSDGQKDWFEFWPILTFLRTNPLEEGVWYGFVSPKFFTKTGLDYEDIERLVRSSPDADVALASSRWPSIAVHRNAWTHGDSHHDGLLTATEAFLRSLGHEPDLARQWGDFSNTVFSNYFFARKHFWEAWRELAEAYLAYVGSEEGASHREIAPYFDESNVQLKVFVQERLVCWLLASDTYKTVWHDYPNDPRCPVREFAVDEAIVRRLYAQRNDCKHRYRKTGGIIDLLRLKIVGQRLARVYRIDDRSKPIRQREPGAKPAP